ncbi:transposase [Stenotrophomonas koreensis]|uniref:PD-(D/E)XK nuclease domain-containing protein n=1 Tax=Stenotrophomonas koreensis TaxID=266128 RepID=UPI0009FB3E6B|nr:transposase [Stenotrophomonas koreensis]
MRLSRSLCAVVGESLRGSHDTLNALFIAAGAPGEPPALSHGSKWKEWLFRAGQDPAVDSLAVLGNVLEEFMDLPPLPSAEDYDDWKQRRARIEGALEENGLRYYRFGRVLPQGVGLGESEVSRVSAQPLPSKPARVEELLEIIVRGLRRAMHPLTHRRKGTQPLSFGSEYDVQDLLHALLRPWVSDIRPEEFTPSYAGSSTRMDFLLPAHKLVIETKIVRDRAHARRVGDELIVDIDHYRRHPSCQSLWCVIYDPDQLITNADGLKTDLQGPRSSNDGTVHVRVFVL